MGLFAKIDLSEDLHLHPSTFWGEVEPIYQDGYEIFKEVFLEIIADFCPVRTGNLIRSIECEWEDIEIYAQTFCDYAEYVEYGTWYMEAQPYFEVAVVTAFYQAYDAWVEAYEEALGQEYDIIVDDILTELAPEVDDITSAEEYAEYVATQIVEAQRSYLEINPKPPEIIII